MFLSQVSILLLWTLAVLTTAEPLCDPETQYLLNGECCQKCKPGTSMESRGVCRSPVCKDCDENEYMAKYNTESVCESQPFCDPNSNFEWPESTSKTEKHQCLCKKGFHCSSASCITCVPHTECGPGYGATTIGDQNHDTVCKKCPVGTFSDEKSWNGTCKEKTICLYGAVPQDDIAEFDHECVRKRAHVGLIVCIVLIALIVVVGAGAFFKLTCKGKTGHEPLKIDQRPIESEAGDDFNCHLDKVAIEDEEKSMPFITNPTDDTEEFRSPSQESTYHSGPPVETEDVVFTANGDVLSQDGKEHVISQPETQAIVIN